MDFLYFTPEGPYSLVEWLGIVYLIFAPSGRQVIFLSSANLLYSTSVGFNPLVARFIAQEAGARFRLTIRWLPVRI